MRTVDDTEDTLAAEAPSLSSEVKTSQIQTDHEKSDQIMVIQLNSTQRFVDQTPIPRRADENKQHIMYLCIFVKKKQLQTGNHSLVYFT